MLRTGDPDRSLLFLLSTIGPIRITQLMPREFSGVTKVTFVAPINSLRIFWCNWCFFLRGTTQGGAICPGNYAY